MKVLRLTLLVTIVLTLSGISTYAQETTSTETEARKTNTEPDGLPEFVIEVRRPEGCLVAPVSAKTKTGYLLYALPRSAQFPRGAASQFSASKVFVSAEQKGAQWDVRVTIGTGEFYDAGDTKVGEFALNLNQRTMVPEFSRFALPPIQVGVVKIIRTEASTPYLNSQAPSISVESIETKDVPDPFKVRLRNNSNVDLIAIQYNKFRRNVFVELKWLSDGLTNPLIKAGQAYELKVASEDNSCGDDEGYRPNQSNRIDIVSAVFADGTIEGEAGLPALIKGAALGNRKNLERVVDALRYVKGGPEELANELNNLQLNMDEATDPSMVDSLRTLLPPMPEDATTVIDGFIRSGMHDVKNNLERDAYYYREILVRRNNPQRSKLWAEQTRAKYERWLEAAEKITTR